MTTTYLIIGLGNKGREYSNTRHNVGFMLVDRLAQDLQTRFTRLEHKALTAHIHDGATKIILAKPQTYMNLSGQAVGALLNFYKVPRQNLLVAYDDVDLPLAALRIRPKGGSAGQKGMKSIIEHLASEEFARMRIGIGRPPGRMDAATYVLQPFTPAERAAIDQALANGAQAVLTFIREGLDAAMNRYNVSTTE